MHGYLRHFAEGPGNVATAVDFGIEMLLIVNRSLASKTERVIAKVCTIDIPSSLRSRFGTICYNCRRNFVCDDQRHPYADRQTFGYRLQ
jgi:hypothetical protein